MATEKEANLAREKFSDQLRKLGAHAMAVDQVSHKGKKTFAVIAFVEGELKENSLTLDIDVGDKKVTVPLVVKKSERFKFQ